LRAADRVVAPTTAVLNDLARHYGFDRGSGLGSGIVIPNGIDIVSYMPRPKRAAIMAAGRLWDEAKNLALLDEAAVDIDWPIEIAGDANHPEGGQARLRAARALGILTPTEMAERLGTTAIYAAPARYEPFGLGILEAAASGCALVLGDIPSLRENWDGAALFVPPDDATAWRTTLCCLIACDSRREALGEAARRRALDFTRERMAARYAELYRELADARQDIGPLVYRPRGGSDPRHAPFGLHRAVSTDERSPV
jgi:glycosyltransferase involved in cell wall biosynthesis